MFLMYRSIVLLICLVYGDAKIEAGTIRHLFRMVGDIARQVARVHTF